MITYKIKDLNDDIIDGIFYEYISMDIYLKLDICLQADIFDVFRNTIWDKFEIDCSKYITTVVSHIYTHDLAQNILNFVQPLQNLIL